MWSVCVCEDCKGRWAARYRHTKVVLCRAIYSEVQLGVHMERVVSVILYRGRSLVSSVIVKGCQVQTQTQGCQTLYESGESEYLANLQRYQYGQN